MKVQNEDIHQRLCFIDRTIDHALRACDRDTRAPEELKLCVRQLGQRSSQAQRALESRDTHVVRQTVDDLARLSDKAQHQIHPSDGMDYELKSAVILAHIELSALRHQLD